MQVNRLVAAATFVLGLAAAIAPVVSEQDWSSPATFITGIGISAAAALTWLNGWQKHEAQQATARDVDKLTAASEKDAAAAQKEAPYSYPAFFGGSSSTGTLSNVTWESDPPDSDPGDLDDPGGRETVVDDIQVVTAHEGLKDG